MFSLKRWMVLWCVCWCCAVSSVYAVTLSGTVFASTTPMSGAAVRLLNSGGTVAASTGVASDGSYRLSASTGTYDLEITPPSGTLFSTYKDSGLSLTADLVKNVVLINASVYQLTGNVTFPANLPRPATVTMGAGVQVEDTRSNNVTVASTGAYTLNVTPDTKYLGVFASYATDASTGSNSLMYRTQLSVSGDAQKNISLSVIKITGRVTNSSGVGVAGTQVNFLKNGNPGALIETYASFTAISGADGTYTAYVLPGDMTVTLTPSSSATAYASSTQTFYANADTVQNFALSNASRLTGVVTFPTGITRPSTITLGVGSKVEDTRVNTVSVGSDGAYAIAVQPDTQYVGVFASFANDAATLSNSVMYRAQVSVSGDTQKNFSIPLLKVTGQVTDGSGNGVAGVQLSFLKNGNPGAAVETYASYTAVSDAAGQYVAYLVPGDVSVTLTPATNSAFAGSSESFNLAANSTKNFALSRLNQLTGVVTFPAALPRPATVTLGLGAQVEETRSNNVTVNTDGSYAIALKSDNQYVGVFAAFANDATTLSNSLMYRAQLTATGSATKDVSFPMIKVSGRVTDRNGVGIAGVQLSFLKNGNPGAFIETYASATVVSGVNGAYTTYLVPGDVSLTVVPPAGSGFSGATLSAVPMLQTLVQDLVLVFKDTVPPIIVSGPLVKSITSTTAVVEWQTNEPTTGSVSTGNISATSSVLATTHSVQLKGLSASTPYNITVSATDASSNGPTTKTGGFTTAAVADSVAPVILMGPTVTSRTEKGLVVEWITNEPAQGSVLYGAGNFDSSAAETTYSVVHRMALSGLTSNTSYQIKVTAKDVSGNGPTTSRTVTGLTLPSADTTPPVLTNGPLISSITDKSVMVNWITDKPSVSGVSWNDGTAYGVLTDPKLQTNHVQQVVGLSPNTTYYLTVSSTDELGNGPTLSKTVSFKTLAAASSKGPQVLLAPQISTITNNSAVVTWYTDQPSTSQVSYGTAQGSLTQSESQATLSVKHSVPLINLSPSTTYYLQVNSVNAAGANASNSFTNTQTNSTVIPFTTLANATTQAPSFDTPPAVGYATDKQAVIGWTTDKVADTVVTLTNLTTNEPAKVAVNGSLDASHQLSVTGLTPGSTYRATVTSTDMAGNTSTQVLPDFSTPPQPDAQTPQIVQGPGIQTTASTATITWTTDKISDSQVSYSSNGVTQVTGDIGYTKQHKVVLGNLSAATSYQISVVSKDPSGNSSTAASASFTTNNADGSGGTSVTTNSATTTTVGTITTTTQSSTGGTSTGSTANTSLNAVSLVKGWNLIGNGADQSINVSSVFNDSSKFTTVWKWVASSTKWAFYAPSLSGANLSTYAAGKGYDVLSTINGGEGFWVNAAQAVTINLQTGSTTPTGIASSSFQTGGSKALPQGWSLIAVGDNKTASEFNLSLSITPPTTSAAPLNLTTLWAWDAAVSNWMFFAPSLVNSGTLSSYISSKNYLGFGSKTLTPAMGFWINKP